MKRKEQTELLRVVTSGLKAIIIPFNIIVSVHLALLCTERSRWRLARGQTFLSALEESEKSSLFSLREKRVSLEEKLWKRAKEMEKEKATTTTKNGKKGMK